MGIVIDLVVIAILALNIIIGYKKGLIGVIFNICAFLVAIILTLILYKPVSTIVIDNTQIDENIKSSIMKNNEEKEITQTEDQKNTKLEQYIQDKIVDMATDAKDDIIEVFADTISIKTVQIITGIIVFVIIRIALILLKFVTESIASLPLIKQCNEIGGLLYGVLKGLLIIFLLLAIMFLVISINGNGIIANAIESSYITKILYENNIILKIIL